MSNGDNSARDLTKREYFAGLAMQGIKSSPELSRICSDAAVHNGAKQQEYIAKMAVIDADALLAELAKPAAVEPVKKPEPVYDHDEINF